MFSWYDRKPGWDFRVVGLGCLVYVFKPDMQLKTITIILSVIVSGLGMEGERVGEGERNAAGEVHSGAEQTVRRGRGRPLHAHHQQRDGVGLSVHVQLHGVELLRPRDHDHHAGGDRYFVCFAFGRKKINKLDLKTLATSLPRLLPPDEVPVGIIAAGTVGSTIILFIFLLVLVLIFYRQRKGSESYSPRASSLRVLERFQCFKRIQP